ncbi:MAG TPA: peptide ABC transporter substrate-binding protein [Firmicutes bacterium]|nr:peptide ABC transporter substrate-binding protein [Candidatus Fermentithermobacillaceae bacterium]
MKKAVIWFVAVVLIASLALAGCTPQTEETDTPPVAEEKVLIVRATSDPTTFQPDVAGNDAAYGIAQNVFNRLVKLDADIQVIPDLARSWSSSEDGLSITFNLVQNAKWHDGEPVTSKDVKYTFDYIKDHPECFAHNYFKNVESISAPDDYTVVFHMSRPDSAVLGYLAWYATFIMPEHVYNNGQPWEENPANQAPIGSGPFKFEKHNPGVNVVLVKNSEYWEAEPKLDKLIYQIIPDDATAVQALLNGEVDYMTLPATEVESFKSNPDFTLVPYSLPSPLYMVFNFDEGKDVPFAVRKAIAMCINRDEISTKVFAGIQPPEYNFYPSVMGWSSNSDAPAPSFDIEGAKAVLEAAGYTKDAEGYYVRGLVVDCFSQSYIDAVKLISAACKDAGIELIINALEGQAWSTKVSTNQDFVIATLGGFQGPDVSALAGRISTEGAMNHGDYSNARIDELFELGLVSTDPAVRKPYYHEIQKIMSEELPTIPIVGYQAYTCQASYVKDSPYECAGRAGWSEYLYTDIVK